MTTTLTLIQPDDWHIHLRDGAALSTTVPHAAASFNRVICMPNLVPPVKTTAEAIAYRERILAALSNSDITNERKAGFDPRMVLYLTDHTSADDIKMAVESGVVSAVKLYPAGATTNSADGVTDILGRAPVFEAMQKYGLPLLVHGEVTHNNVDIFDREKRFLDDVLSKIIANFPALKIVMEHITTADAADFCLAQGDNIAATITPQHLLFNRNHLLVGGVKPHYYCLPILKRANHQQRLLEVATSGNPKFFIGTDSAPHATHTKESACGCAGCYSAVHALPLYAAAFESMNALDKLENFTSVFGARFYGLPVNTSSITLIKKEQTIPESYPYLDGKSLTPLLAGQTLAWQQV
ncbi:dihydroorotase [Moraxella caviae]|uniref:Dihydroorotase n=1 Tax=Moraxella caviae TaxID=34060 RepID=A0A1S9ZWA1_9GAMM|nr:dihydroorotase [Moraxella caviae]OOR87713.1 dihydroorotase [Moraxella caviae]STZ10122.1 Dihydroorotase [Moraxella caviae]VEW11109.1 Dihydroorotase [Moraxella caviae]